MTHPIDLTPLSNAVDRLSEGLARYLRDVSDTQIRDGLIQRFVRRSRSSRPSAR